MERNNRCNAINIIAAIIGVKSIIPKRGTTLDRGTIRGSVI